MSRNSQGLSTLPQGAKLSRPSTSVAVTSTKDVCKSQESCPRSPADVRSSLVATYRYETQQEPNGDAIDIIGLSELYIRAQISDSNATANTSNQNITVSQHLSARNAPNRHARRHGHGHGHSHMSPRRTYTLDTRAVDGPIQCGEGTPCKDGACCNKDGKW
jgi:hypothetical protein